MPQLWALCNQVIPHRLCLRQIPSKCWVFMKWMQVWMQFHRKKPVSISQRMEGRTDGLRPR